MARTITDEEKEFLTADELAALNDDDDAPDMVDEDNLDETEEPETSGTAPEIESEDAETGGEEEAEAASATAKAGAEVDEGDDQGETTVDTPSASRTAPLLTADVPADAQEKLAAIRAEREALAEKFDEGELSAREYAKRLDELAEQSDELKLAMFKAELASDMTKQQRELAWADDVKAFVGQHKEIGSSQTLWNAYDQAVRRITGDKDNAALTNEQVLRKAYALMNKELGRVAPPQPKPTPKPKAEQRKVPLTLAHVPSADISDTEDGKFAALDRLSRTDTDAYERALSRLSAAELEDYERVSA